MDHVLPAIIVLVGGDGRHPQVWNPAVLDVETVLGVISKGWSVGGLKNIIIFFIISSGSCLNVNGVMFKQL